MAREKTEIYIDRSELIPKRNVVYFFDLNKRKVVAPKTENIEGKSDLSILLNEQAVFESIYNILLTQPGDRVMDPKFGIDLNQYLFRQIDSVTAQQLMLSVYNNLKLYETRITELEVVVTPDIDHNTFIIDVFFAINTGEELSKLVTTLSKLR